MSELAVGVNIVLADRDWILQRLGNEIADRHDYVTVTDRADPAAGLHYYINYSARRRPMPGIEIGYFTHIEQDEGARAKFFEIAAEMDHCVCHSERYAQELRAHGIKNVSVISPGVDLDRFQPVLKVGVVGRTYDSGRKGEALVDAVRDIPGIEWHFTGAGWPEPARAVADEDMPAFYNEMDVILVPSLYEGGPMSVAEAVACGTTVIAPDVGWVKQFPHKGFKAGDEKSLRRALETALAERTAQRSHVATMNWDAWASAHDSLFRALLAERELTPVRVDPPLTGPVALVLHGSEAIDKGGPALRVPRTRTALQDLGVEAASLSFPDPAIDRAALIHGFNLWQPSEALALARYATERGKPFVLSPIYLDQREHQLWQSLVPAALSAARSPAEVPERLATAIATSRRSVGGRALQAAPGYDAVARALIGLADGVIYLSEHERELLSAIGADSANGQVVRNPVDAARFADADPDAFAETIGVRDYVLCVGRIEPRKNQAMLVQALRETNVPVVLLGSDRDGAYRRIVESAEAVNVHFVSRLEADDPLLASAYAGARVLVQPSWAEGAPLVALEAAAAGTPLILSDRSSEREYFGDLARYCDPADLTDIRDAILDAFETPRTEGDRGALRDLVQERHSYERHARDTLAVYQSVLANYAPRPTRTAERRSESAARTVVIDLTDLARQSRANLTTRAIREVADALLATDLDVRLIAWNKTDRRFVAIDASMLGQQLGPYVDFASRTGLLPADLPQGARLFVLGDEWTRDGRYVDDLAMLTGAHGLELITYLHVAHFLERSHRASVLDAPGRVLATMIAASNIVLVPSPGVAAELGRYASERGISPVRTAIVRPGDRFVAQDGEAVTALPDRPYALAVAIDGVGDDEHVLARVWRGVSSEGKGDALLVIATPATDTASSEWAKGVSGTGLEVRMGVTEAELDSLYDGAAMVVAAPGTGRASGRVLAEAVARSKIAIGPRTAATEEAVGTAADLIDPIDLKRWSARLTYYLRSRAARQAGIDRSAFQQATTWSDAAQAMLAATGDSFAPRGAYTLGQKGQLTDRPGNLRKREGWHRSMPWGCWSSARTASFDFVLAEPAGGPLTLCLELRSPLTERQDNVCDVVVNGAVAGRVVLRGPGWCFFTIPVAATSISGKTILTVELRGSRLIELTKVFPGEEPGRRGGIALAAAALVDPAYPANFADYPTHDEALLGAIDFGQDIDLVRDPRAPAILPERSVIGTDWGARHVDYRPQLLVKAFGAGREPLSLTVRYRAVASPLKPIAAMATTREGVFLGRIEASDDAIHEAVLQIPAGTNVQPLLIEFLGAPKASPDLIGVGLSKDAFGIGFFGLRLDRVSGSGVVTPETPPAYAIGSLLALGLHDSDPQSVSATAYLKADSWHDREDSGIWSQDGGGRLDLKLEHRPVAPLHVRVDASCALDPAGAITARIWIGGLIVHSERRDDDQPFAMEFLLDPDLVDPDGTVRITFDTDRAVVPSRSATWVDDRRLGLFVRSLMIAEHASALRGSMPFDYNQAEYLPDGDVFWEDPSDLQGNGEDNLESENVTEVADALEAMVPSEPPALGPRGAMAGDAADLAGDGPSLSQPIEGDESFGDSDDEIDASKPDDAGATAADAAVLGPEGGALARDDEEDAEASDMPDSGSAQNASPTPLVDGGADEDLDATADTPASVDGPDAGDYDADDGQGDDDDPEEPGDNVTTDDEESATRPAPDDAA